MSDYDYCGVIILIVAVCAICFALGRSNPDKARTLQLQQLSKDWKWPNSIIDKADLMDEQDVKDPRFGFRSLREFGHDFVDDVVRPEEEIGNLDMDPDQYLINPIYHTEYPGTSSAKATKIQIDENDDGEVELEIDLSQEPAGEFTKTEVLVNPLISHQVGDIIVGEGRGRRSRAMNTPPPKGAQSVEAFGEALVRESSRGGRDAKDIGLDVPPKCQQRGYENDPDCMAWRLADSDSTMINDAYIHGQTLPRAGAAPDATMMSRSQIDKLAADTLHRYPQNPTELRGHHSQLASRHVQDTSNATKRLSAASYMTPEQNGSSQSELPTPTIPQGVKRSAQNKQHQRGAYTYQVFCTSQNLVYTPVTVMPYDEYNQPMLVEPLVFNFQNSFITSNGVQELSFSTERYVDIKFLEINTLLTQKGWNGKIWVRIFAEGNLISTLDYNSAVDPRFGWQRFVCTSGQAAYTRENAESTCIGGRVRR